MWSLGKALAIKPKDGEAGQTGPMEKRTIAGKITVEEGVTTVDLRMGGQTLKLTIAEAQALARAISRVATTVHEKIWSEKTKG